MIANAKNGVSSHEIARAIGVTQKTAWFMLQRIRLTMQGDDGGKLRGEVEIDKTFIGGKARNMHISQSRSMAGKVAVMGLLERHGNNRSQVRLSVVRGVRKSHLMPQIFKHVELGSTINTDALPS